MQCICHGRTCPEWPFWGGGGDLADSCSYRGSRLKKSRQAEIAPFRLKPGACVCSSQHMALPYRALTMSVAIQESFALIPHVSNRLNLIYMQAR